MSIEVPVSLKPCTARNEWSTSIARKINISRATGASYHASASPLLLFIFLPEPWPSDFRGGFAGAPVATAGLRRGERGHGSPPVKVDC